MYSHPAYTLLIQCRQRKSLSSGYQRCVPEPVSPEEMLCILTLTTELMFVLTIPILICCLYTFLGFSHSHTFRSDLSNSILMMGRTSIQRPGSTQTSTGGGRARERRKKEERVITVMRQHLRKVAHTHTKYVQKLHQQVR